jgi:hypothetical protein
MNTVVAFRSREQLETDKRAAELPHRREYLDPTNQRIGSPLGKAVIMGLITEDEYTSGVAWGKVHSDYLDTIMNPDGHTFERCELAVKRYNRGLEILEKHPKRVFHAVMALAAYGEDWGDLNYTAAAARIGLSELPTKF